jgi:sulfate/thiosulfate transport system permease protein
MSAPAIAAPFARRLRVRADPPAALGAGLVTVYLSVLVLLPIAAVVAKSTGAGPSAFWHAITAREAVAAIRLTLLVSLAVAAINAVLGTLLAWLLVRDAFPGRRVVDAVIDLPFVLPTIVAGIALLALYGPKKPVGIDVAFTVAGILMALLFVTLPFVVRSVQPVLEAMDPAAEEAATTLGASPWMVFRRIIAPSIAPAVASGAALSFARAVGEFGSIVLISGSLPFKTELASVYIFGQIESDNVAGAAAVSTLLLAIALLVLVTLRLLASRMQGR